MSYHDLCALVEQGVIENSSVENVNSSSIDLVLGDKILIENPVQFDSRCKTIDMTDKSTSRFIELNMPETGYIIQPGECVLAHSKEVFNLPNWISAEYKLKSTQARNFLEHLNAGWCDAGWHGSVLTLEFVNMNRFHGIRIKPGMKCGQVVFFQHDEVPSEKSYAVRGQYNNDISVSQGKGLK